MRIRLNTMTGGALALCLLSFASPAWSAGPRVHVIEIDKLAFGPAPEGLHVNDIVEWTNADIFQHTATAMDGTFDIDLPAGAKGRAALEQAGVVSYFCRYHPGMKGRLEVAP
jgi:plastocyanin